ncbi:AAA family ATPase [Kallotenue papyrolyticum]|uniref:AAA family ATPase n=1 Tax=Kallotenue papyrolyticum TaxID=1325125 RepID=UPI0004785B22|nr:AAA family ATPase [Kallotenue papyrolyticum]
MHDTRRPLGVFLFFGPTGVGKTELARALVGYLFGDEQRLVRFNMPDLDENTLFGYSHAWTLQGRRGQLTTRLNNQPLPVLLLDEFEKTKKKEHDLFQRFLQLFDEGTLINGVGEEINLRNSIIILTSNLAAELIYQGDLGFTSQRESASLEQRAARCVEEFYTPEFVNRIDQIVFFHPLTRTTIRLIARRELNELLRRDGVLRRGIAVEFDDALVDWILDRRSRL